MIRFCRVREKHGAFSNFAPYPISLKRKTWPTTEHYFQAMKFEGTEYEEVVRRAKSPMQAKRLAHKKPLPRNWLRIRDEVMLEAVRAKFAQHADLAELLRSTGHEELVEHAPKDDYWGDGGDGSGRNMLGKILMKVREELR